MVGVRRVAFFSAFVLGLVAVVAAPPAGADGSTTMWVKCTFNGIGIQTLTEVERQASDTPDPVTVGGAVANEFTVGLPFTTTSAVFDAPGARITELEFKINTPADVTVDDVSFGPTDFTPSAQVDGAGDVLVTLTGDLPIGSLQPVPEVPEIEVGTTVLGSPRTISWNVASMSVELTFTTPPIVLAVPCQIGPPEHPVVPPMLTTEVVAGAAGHPFSDVPPWVEDAVDWVSENGLMTGYDDNTFRGDLSITRAQVARLLYRIAGEPDVAGLDPLEFTDVPAWVRDAVRWLAHFEFVTGYDDNTFRGDLPITRAQVARMMFRTNGSPGNSPPHPFSDVAQWVEDAVDWLADPANVPPYVTGYDDNTFRGDLSITRAQTTRMACRVHTPPGTC